MQKALYLSLMALVAVLVFEVLWLPHYVGARVQQRLDPVLTEASTTIKESHAFVKDLHASWDDLYWDIKASVESATASSKETYEMVADVHAHLTGGKDSRGITRVGLLPQITDSVVAIQSLTKSLQADLHQVAQSSNDTLKPLQVILENIARLSDDLDKQVKSSSPQISETITELNKSFHDLDTLLADPNIQKTISHVEGTAETVDIAMAPLRKKAKLAMVILTHALNLVKFTIPF